MLENFTAKAWVFMYAFHSWQDDGGHFFNESIKKIEKPLIAKPLLRLSPKQILKVQAYESYNHDNL